MASAPSPVKVPISSTQRAPPTTISAWSSRASARAAHHLRRGRVGLSPRGHLGELAGEGAGVGIRVAGRLGCDRARPRARFSALTRRRPMTAISHNYSEPTVVRPDSFPMRLYEKAKRLGVWNPAEIDFSQDRADWEGMDGEKQKAILRLTARFLGGEEAVTLDLLPLVLAIAQSGPARGGDVPDHLPVRGGQAHRLLQPLGTGGGGRPGSRGLPSPRFSFRVELPGDERVARGHIAGDDRPRIDDLQHGHRGSARRDRLPQLPPVTGRQRADAGSVCGAGQHQARRVSAHRLRGVPPQPAGCRGPGRVRGDRGADERAAAADRRDHSLRL